MLALYLVLVGGLVFLALATSGGRRSALLITGWAGAWMVVAWFAMGRLSS